MTTLNTPWMISTFVLIAQQTAVGSYAEVDSTLPEIKELVKLRYIKLNKKTFSDGDIVAAVADTGATIEDLCSDLGETVDATVIATVPAAHRQAVLETEAPAPAPVAPVAEEAPQFHGETEAPAPAAVGATQTEEYQVLEEVERRGKSITIEVGIAYKKPETGFARKAPTAEAYPYAEIVEYKAAHPESYPSFHLKDKKSKDVSGMIKRHAQKYEASHGITLRASTVDASDPQGAGVRVYALTIAEAPARRQTKKAEVQATESTQAE